MEKIKYNDESEEERELQKQIVFEKEKKNQILKNKSSNKFPSKNYLGNKRKFMPEIRSLNYKI